MVNWLDQATRAYYQKRIATILNQMDDDSRSKVTQEWDTLLYELYGNSVDTHKQYLIDQALKNGDVSPSGKEWLRKRYKL